MPIHAAWLQSKRNLTAFALRNHACYNINILIKLLTFFIQRLQTFVFFKFLSRFCVFNGFYFNMNVFCTYVEKSSWRPLPLKCFRSGNLHFAYLLASDMQNGRIYSCSILNSYLDISVSTSYARLHITPGKCIARCHHTGCIPYCHWGDRGVARGVARVAKAIPNPSKKKI